MMISRISARNIQPVQRIAHFHFRKAMVPLLAMLFTSHCTTSNSSAPDYLGCECACTPKTPACEQFCQDAAGGFICDCPGAKNTSSSLCDGCENFVFGATCGDLAPGN